MVMHSDDKPVKTGCISRRKFFLGSGAAIAGSIMLPALPGMDGKALAAELMRYPKILVAKLTSLAPGKPVKFNYPDTSRNSNSMLVKLGEAAGGGIGPQRDVVAFNTLCTHMGGNMDRTYQDQHSALGPCPFHQTSFDLTRHGMVIAGHATESLPQVLLELEGDDIYAVGLIGLIYGRYDNLIGAREKDHA